MPRKKSPPTTTHRGEKNVHPGPPMEKKKTSKTVTFQLQDATAAATKRSDTKLRDRPQSAFVRLSGKGRPSAWWMTEADQDGHEEYNKAAKILDALGEESEKLYTLGQRTAGEERRVEEKPKYCRFTDIPVVDERQGKGYRRSEGGKEKGGSSIDYQTVNSEARGSGWSICYELTDISDDDSGGTESSTEDQVRDDEGSEESSIHDETTDIKGENVERYTHGYIVQREEGLGSGQCQTFDQITTSEDVENAIERDQLLAFQQGADEEGIHEEEESNQPNGNTRRPTGDAATNRSDSLNRCSHEEGGRTQRETIAQNDESFKSPQTTEAAENSRKDNSQQTDTTNESDEAKASRGKAEKADDDSGDEERGLKTSRDRKGQKADEDSGDEERGVKTSRDRKGPGPVRQQRDRGRGGSGKTPAVNERDDVADTSLSRTPHYESYYNLDHWQKKLPYRCDTCGERACREMSVRLCDVMGDRVTRTLCPSCCPRGRLGAMEHLNGCLHFLAQSGFYGKFVSKEKEQGLYVFVVAPRHASSLAAMADTFRQHFCITPFLARGEARAMEVTFLQPPSIPIRFRFVYHVTLVGSSWGPRFHRSGFSLYVKKLRFQISCTDFFYNSVL